MTEQDKLAADFEAHRPYLHAIAFRVLGSHADADDAVQETWLRLARAGGRPFILMAFTVEDGRITTIRMLSDPRRLAQLVPSWVA